MRPVYPDHGYPWLRALAWPAIGGAALALGLALLGLGALALGSLRTGVWPTHLQRAAWGALFEAVLRQALLPHVLLTAAGWLALVRVAPRLDRSWRTLVPGLLALAGAAFPIVARGFSVWSPASAADVVSTALLLSASAAAALLLPRALVRALGPGAFARSPSAK